MVSKDQTLGALIFLVCAVVAIGYIIAMVFPGQVAEWISPIIDVTAAGIRYWLVGIPVLVAFVVVLAIGAWIGWTMATTPPPKPLEEIEAEEKAEEKEEEKVEEAKPEEKPEPTEKVEAGKEKKKKK